MKKNLQLMMLLLPVIKDSSKQCIVLNCAGSVEHP